MKYEIRTLADIFNKVPVDKIELCMAEIAAAMVMGKGTLGMMQITGQWPDVVEWIDDGAGNVGAEIVIGDDVLEIKKKLLVPLPVAMWGETHEERYCKKCGLNMCNHFWMASRGGGYVVCPT